MFPTKIYQGALFLLFTDLWNHPPAKTEKGTCWITRTFHNKKKRANKIITLAHVDKYFTDIYIYIYMDLLGSNFQTNVSLAQTNIIQPSCLEPSNVKSGTNTALSVSLP